MSKFFSSIRFNRLVKHFLILLFILLIRQFVFAQYTGGNGRGDINVRLLSRLLNGSTIEPSGLVVTKPLKNLEAGGLFNLHIELVNANNRIVTSATNSISISIENNPGSGTLSGTITKSASRGACTFSELSINESGHRYTLSANSGTLQVISNEFNVYNNFYKGGSGKGDYLANLVESNLGNTFFSAGNWNESVKWTSGELPDQIERAYIGAASQINVLQTAGDIYILANQSITIQQNGELTVNGTLINTAGELGLILQSDATGTGSLLHSTANVPGTVQVVIPSDAGKWHMISSPVAAQAATGAFIQYGHLFCWSEAAQDWVNSVTTQGWPTWAKVNNSSDNFIPAKGYLVMYDVNAPNRTFTGNLNQGLFSLPLTLDASVKDKYHGFNIAGNPYPSAIDWKATEGWDRSKLEVTGGGNAYWVWNGTAGNYGTFMSNGSDGSGINLATRYLSPFQAFWVRAIAVGDITMDNRIRVHSTTTLLKEATTNSNLLLAVSGNANTYTDETVVSLGNTDNTGGAQKMFSLYSTAPSLYTLKSGLNYSINLLSDSPKQPIVTVFKPGATGNYTIKATGGLLSKNVVLEDIQTGIRTTLSMDNSYTFKASTTDNPKRFLLHFGSTTSAGSIAPTGSLATYNHGSLSILNPYNGRSRADLYNVNGRLISAYQLNQTGKQQFNIELLQSGVYLIRISSSNETITGKLLVRE